MSPSLQKLSKNILKKSIRGEFQEKHSHKKSKLTLILLKSICQRSIISFGNLIHRETMQENTITLNILVHYPAHENPIIHSNAILISLGRAVITTYRTHFHLKENFSLFSNPKIQRDFVGFTVDLN